MRGLRHKPRHKFPKQSLIDVVVSSWGSRYSFRYSPDASRLLGTGSSAIGWLMRFWETYRLI
jgi:hypothetical protein